MSTCLQHYYHTRRDNDSIMFGMPSALRRAIGRLSAYSRSHLHCNPLRYCFQTASLGASPSFEKYFIHDGYRESCTHKGNPLLIAYYNTEVNTYLIESLIHTRRKSEPHHTHTQREFILPMTYKETWMRQRLSGIHGDFQAACK